MTRDLIDAAVASGARRGPACQLLGLSVRTLERWRGADHAAAARWVTTFVHWYNHVHQHSAIRFVTPEDRHTGRDRAILATRHTVYVAARARTPARWSGPTRNWTPITVVRLNPARDATPVAQGRAA